MKNKRRTNQRVDSMADRNEQRHVAIKGGISPSVAWARMARQQAAVPDWKSEVGIRRAAASGNVAVSK